MVPLELTIPFYMLRRGCFGIYRKKKNKKKGQMEQRVGTSLTSIKSLPSLPNIPVLPLGLYYQYREKMVIFVGRISCVLDSLPSYN